MTETEATPAAPPKPHLLRDARTEKPVVVEAAGGWIGAFSFPSPPGEGPNEDAAAVIPLGNNAAVLAVADGVGGHLAGELASRTAVEALRDTLKSLEDPGAAREAILAGIDAANRKVLSLEGDAATTLAVVEVNGDTMRSYHIGDSMVFCIGGRGKVKLATVPHSPVGQAVDAGVLDERDAMHHDERHVVSNVVGSESMRVEVGPQLRLSPRDTIVLASDGLVDNLYVEEIASQLHGRRMAKLVERLAAAARGRMTEPTPGCPSKPDDLTFLVFRRWGR